MRRVVLSPTLQNIHLLHAMAMLDGAYLRAQLMLWIESSTANGDLGYRFVCPQHVHIHFQMGSLKLRQVFCMLANCFQ